MKYFFVLGNNPSLSVAEIIAKFGYDREKCNWVDRDVFILETEKPINAKEEIRKIGGTIKISEIIGEADEKELKDKIISILDKNKSETGQSKFRFGISFYGKERFDAKNLAMEVKKEAKEYGLSCKWAGGKDKNLSSVAVEKNKLVGGGAEIVLVKNANKKFLIGKTLAVQPFEALSFRDYGRPGRDDYSGMIPPKLAQIMLNLAYSNNLNKDIHKNKIPLDPPFLKGENKKDKVICDPFCGSGTILTESLLMGCRNIIGTDDSSRAIRDTKKNIQWVADNFGLKDYKCKIYEKEVSKISSILVKNSVDAIVTEPFLGPQRGKHSRSKTARSLEKMYVAALAEFRKILKPGGKAVMIWPVFVAKKDFHRDLKFLFLDYTGYKMKKILPDSLLENPYAKTTKRGTIIYGRKGQKVWREIVVLEKQ